MPTHCPFDEWKPELKGVPTVCGKKLISGTSVTATTESPTNWLHCPTGHYSFSDGELTA